MHDLPTYAEYVKKRFHKMIFRAIFLHPQSKKYDIHSEIDIYMKLVNKNKLHFTPNYGHLCMAIRSYHYEMLYHISHNSTSLVEEWRQHHSLPSDVATQTCFQAMMRRAHEDKHEDLVHMLTALGIHAIKWKQVNMLTVTSSDIQSTLTDFFAKKYSIQKCERYKKI